SPRAMSPSLTTSSISRNDMSAATLSATYSTSLPRSAGPVCLQTRSEIRIFIVRCQCRMPNAECQNGSGIHFGIEHSAFGISLVTPLRRLHVLEVQRLLVKLGLHAHAFEFPGRDVREVL